MERLEVCGLTEIDSEEAKCNTENLAAKSKANLKEQNSKNAVDEICKVAKAKKDEMTCLGSPVFVGDENAVVPSNITRAKSTAAYELAEESDVQYLNEGRSISCGETLGKGNDTRCSDTPEDNILGQKQGDIDCQVFPAEESYDLSAITLTGVDSSNLGYVASSELPDDEEEEFSTAEFLAAIAATNFNESGDVLKAVCETDRDKHYSELSNDSLHQDGLYTIEPAFQNTCSDQRHEYEADVTIGGQQAVPGGIGCADQNIDEYQHEIGRNVPTQQQIIFVPDENSDGQSITHYHQRICEGTDKDGDEQCDVEQSVPVDLRYGLKEVQNNSSKPTSMITASQAHMYQGAIRNKLGHYGTDVECSHGNRCPAQDAQSVPVYEKRDTQLSTSENGKQIYCVDLTNETQDDKRDQEQLHVDKLDKQMPLYQTNASWGQSIPEPPYWQKAGKATSGDSVLEESVPARRTTRAPYTRDTSQAVRRPAGQSQSYIEHQIFYVDGGGEGGEKEKKRRVYRVNPSAPSQRRSQNNPQTAGSYVPIAPRPREPVIPPEARGIAPKPPGVENHFSPKRKRPRAKPRSIPYYVVVVPAPALYQRMAERRAAQADKAPQGGGLQPGKTPVPSGQFVPPRPRTPLRDRSSSPLMSPFMRVSPRNPEQTDVPSTFITVSSATTPITPLDGRSQQFVINHGGYSASRDRILETGDVALGVNGTQQMKQAALCQDSHGTGNARVAEIRLPENCDGRKQSRYALLKEKLQTQRGKEFETIDLESECLQKESAQEAVVPGAALRSEKSPSSLLHVVPQTEVKKKETAGKQPSRGKKAADRTTLGGCPVPKAGETEGEGTTACRSEAEVVRRKSKDRELRDKMNAKFEQMRKIIPSASTTTAKIPLLRLAATYIEELHARIERLQLQVCDDSSPDLQCVERLTDSPGCSPESAETQPRLADNTTNTQDSHHDDQTFNSTLMSCNDERTNDAILPCDDRSDDDDNEDGTHLVPLHTAETYSALIQQIASVLGPMSPNSHELQPGESQSRFVPLMEVPHRLDGTTGLECFSPQASFAPCIPATISEEALLNIGVTVSPFSSPVLPAPRSTPQRARGGDCNPVQNPNMTEAVLSPSQIVERFVTLHPQTPEENDASDVCRADQNFSPTVAANIEIVTTPPASGNITQYITANTPHLDSYGLDIVSEAAALVDQRDNTEVPQSPETPNKTGNRAVLVEYNHQGERSPCWGQNSLLTTQNSRPPWSTSPSSVNAASSKSRWSRRKAQTTPKSRLAIKAGVKVKKDTQPSEKFQSTRREKITSDTVNIPEISESPIAKSQLLTRRSPRAHMENSRTRSSPKYSKSDTQAICDVMQESIAKSTRTPPGTALVTRPSRPCKRKPAASVGGKKTRAKHPRV